MAKTKMIFSPSLRRQIEMAVDPQPIIHQMIEAEGWGFEMYGGTADDFEHYVAGCTAKAEKTGRPFIGGFHHPGDWTHRWNHGGGKWGLGGYELIEPVVS